jgi:hypothetical protein
MSNSITKKQYIIAGVVFLALVVVNVVVFWIFLRPGIPPNTFGGKVITVSSSTLAVTDVRGRTEFFTIATSTKIVFGKHVSSETDLTPGAFVMVSTASHEPSATATKVRIMSTDPFTKAHKPVTP